MSCRIFLYLLLVLLPLAGCDKPTAADKARPGSPAPASPYYNVRGQLDSLVRVLDARHTAVQKTVSLRGSQSETTQVNQVKWADELQLFYQADINKAALRGAYAVQVTQRGEGGLPVTQYEYTRKPNQPNAAVARLRIECYPGRRLRALEAIIEQQNALFTSEKHLAMRCDNLAQPVVSYEVRGRQKLILFDSLSFATRARTL